MFLLGEIITLCLQCSFHHVMCGLLDVHELHLRVSVPEVSILQFDFNLNQYNLSGGCWSWKAVFISSFFISMSIFRCSLRWKKYFLLFSFVSSTCTCISIYTIIWGVDYWWTHFHSWKRMVPLFITIHQLVKIMTLCVQY